ncbi:outer membrane beta-barrel protein [Fluoribacter dumoffii]|uniref:Uncharacterized protein n=1 Tax=Fluoribacter dumoffii TaxID=463 RepID=A0A377GCK0_9GAMM|nr:outer membrane beta-barrel protein [Fluoribacter dumoffii]KTC90930.1 hypothetical protein Ldum_1998 [Fluoribacter dumoffii NY 23]MCW8386499.1 outer membrane beta-barrel protein [Fluoribacter dumoffii]MCW8419553.1 outer membrane beta-barrel protein [Fluoribacter dumoffii]MCW8455744.1 outer membrane beta-barrel protein [Fluoribacter dumoffii]MCW8460177.1 outer membrane beta-barrel protein [Fluoribacter dumoffii]
MRQMIKFGFILGLVASSNAFSADPVEGLYLGLLGQLSHAPNTNFNFNLNGTTYDGSLKLSVVGGGVGTSLGYKIKNFRLEGEFLFNINNYGSLTVGSCTLISPSVLGPNGTCPTEIEESGLGFNGYTMGFYGLFNTFYDFLSSDPNVNFVPYLGVGLGGALLKNHALFHSNNQCISLNSCSPIISETFDSSSNGFAIQGIVGFSYYLDDFTTLGLDFRYLSTVNFNKNNSTTSSNSNNGNYGIGTINLTANFALEKAD